MPGMILNDIYHDSTTSELKIIHDGDTAAEIYAHITEANYADMREPQNVPGAGGASLGSTRGAYKAEEGTIVMYVARSDVYLRKLDAIAKPRGLTVCDLIQRLQVSYRLPGESTIITDVVTFRLKGVAGTFKVTETGATVRSFKTFVSSVNWNGVELA